MEAKVLMTTGKSKMIGHELTPFQVFMAALALSSFGGLAALLRSERPLTPRAIASAMTYSGAMGVVIALLWYTHFDNGNIYFLLGVSGLAGIGGVTFVDFIIEALKKGGIIISIRSKDHKDGGSQ